MPALYIYSVVDADHPEPIDLAGVGEAPVRLVRHGSLAAAVSEAPDPLVGRRRDLLAHSSVVETLWADGPVLPMRFGVVAPDESALVADVLADETGRFGRSLTALRDRAEMTVKVWHQEDAVLREVLREDRTIASLQERNRRGGASYADRLRLGELVATAVEAKAAADADGLLRDLATFAGAARPGPAVDGAVLNATFLIERDRVDEFLAAVEERMSTEQDRMTYRVAGPMPPYSFVDEGPAAPERDIAASSAERGRSRRSNSPSGLRARGRSTAGGGG
jgi:hypothetical protein